MPLELVGDADQRDHDLGHAASPPGRPHVAARPRGSPAPASRGSRGRVMPSRQPRWPSIGLASASFDPREQRLERSRGRARRRRAAALHLQAWSVRGRNSCSGGSSSRIVTGSPLIAVKIPRSRRAAWAGAWRARPRRSSLVVGQDHLAHRGMPARRRRTCARCGTGRCPRRRTRGPCARPAGVSALARTASPADVVGPAEQLPKSVVDLRRRSGRRAPANTSPGGAVEGDRVALAEDGVADASAACARRRS